MTHTSPKESVLDKVGRVGHIIWLILGLALGVYGQSIHSQDAISSLQSEVQRFRDYQQAFPHPEQIVTKDQFNEVVKRLDEKTDRIDRNIQTLLDAQEKERR